MSTDQVEVPKVERGRDGRWRKPDGFQMIQLDSMERSEADLEETEEVAKWDTLENIDRKSSQQRRKQNRAKRVGSVGVSTALGGAIAAGSSQAMEASTSNMARGLRSSVKGLNRNTSAASVKNRVRALGTTVARNPAGAAIIGGGALAAGGASKFAYHKARENKLNLEARTRRRARVKKNNPDMADSHMPGMLKPLKSAVSQTKPAAKLGGQLAQNKLQNTKRVFGKADMTSPFDPAYWEVSKAWKSAEKRTAGITAASSLVGAGALGAGFGAAAHAKTGRAARTGFKAAGRSVAEGGAAAIGGAGVGLALTRGRSQGPGKALATIGSIGGMTHGAGASVANSRKKGYLRRGV